MQKILTLKKQRKAAENKILIKKYTTDILKLIYYVANDFSR